MVDHLVENLEELGDAPFTISAIGYDLKYIQVNKRLAQHFNKETKDFKNQDIGSFSKNQYFKCLVNKFKNSDDLSFAKEIESVSLDEKIRNYYILGFKRPRCMFFLGIDLSEVKSMEHKIAQQEKMTVLGENMAGLIHEINTPLHAILSQTELMDLKFFKRNKKPSQQEWNDFKEKFDQKFKLLNNIIKSIQTLSYDSDVAFNDFNIHELVNQALTILSYKIKKSNTKISLEHFNYNLKINPSIFIQVVINLINNSLYELKNTENSWINISVEETNNTFILNFTDSGKGIPKEIQKNIFENFFTTKELGSGTGLGLFLCKKYLTKYNADLIYKEKENNTNFQIIFKKEHNE